MIGNIIAKILAGSAVGYITNYIAIQMLFQEYLKFKLPLSGKTFSLGGVIVKERKEFESQISRLVESDVIHHRAIDAELRKAPFERAVQKIVSGFFQEYLPQVLKDTQDLDDIPGFERSIERFKLNLSENLAQSSTKILPLLLSQLELKEICSDTQLEKLSENTQELLRDFIQRDYSSEHLFLGLLEELSQKKWTDFLSENSFEALGKNLSRLLENVHQRIQYNFSGAIEQLIQDLEKAGEVEALIGKVVKEISQRPLKDIFRQENIDYLPEEIIRHIERLFQSEVSEDIIQTLLKFLLNVLKEEKSTLFDLLSDELKETFEVFLARRLPDLLSTLIPWIRRKKAKLESLIQDAFEKNSNAVGRFLVQLFIGNVGKYVGIEERLVSLVEQQDVDLLAKRASNFVLDYLKSNSIGKIIQGFDQEKVLATLSPALNETIRDSLGNLNLGNLGNLFEKPIRTWFSEDKLHHQLNNLKERGLRENLLQGFLYSPNLDAALKKAFHRILEGLREKPQLSGVLSVSNRQSLATLIAEALPDYLEVESERLEAFIRENLIQYRDQHSLHSIIGEHKISDPAFIKEFLDQFLSVELDKIKQNSLESYLEQLKGIEGLDGQVTQLIKNYLLENLPRLMEGQVDALVKDTLSKQPDTKLRDMVRKAMGEELRPLSFFGGILGLFTGAFLLGLPGAEAGLSAVAISGLAYGLTGWGTNWLAIRMLFKPYNAVKIPRTNRILPFTPGVIAKYKARFAKSMGRFIGDRLLNQKDLQEKFNENRAALEGKALDLMSKEDYALIDNLIRQNKDRLSKTLSKDALEYLMNSEKLREKQIFPTLRKAQSRVLKDFIPSELSKSAQDFLHSEKLYDSIEKALRESLAKWSKSEKRLEELISDRQKESLKQGMKTRLQSELEKNLKDLDKNKIWDWINWEKVEHRVDEVLANALGDLLNEAQEDTLKEEVFGFLNAKIQSESVKKSIYDFIDERLNSEFSPEKNLKDFFGGKVMELLEQNLNRILEGVLEMGMEWLAKNKENIADKVYQDARQETALAGMYQQSIKGTIYQLANRGIPDFFQREFISLQKEIHQKIQELGNSPLHNTNFMALNNESLKERVEGILQNEKLMRKIRQLTNIILEERIFKIPLKDLFKDDTPQLVEHLKEVLSPEVEIILDHVKENLKDRENLAQNISKTMDFVWDFIQRQLGSVSLAYLFKGIEEGEEAAMGQSFRSFLKESPTWQREQDLLLEAALERVGGESIGKLVDGDQLERDITKILDKLNQNEPLKNNLEQVLAESIGKGLSSLNQSLASESKDFVIEKMAKSVFLSVEEHVLDLIQSMNFKEIVVREIANMQAQELEKLFYGFARRYFKYLIGYGFLFGILFGLAIDAGLLNLLGLIP